MLFDFNFFNSTVFVFFNDDSFVFRWFLDDHHIFMGMAFFDDDGFMAGGPMASRLNNDRSGWRRAMASRFDNDYFGSAGPIIHDDHVTAASFMTSGQGTQAQDHREK